MVQRRHGELLTKMFFCRNPRRVGWIRTARSAQGPSCAPPGPIPTIYAIAAVGGFSGVRRCMSLGQRPAESSAMIDVSDCAVPRSQRTGAATQPHRAEHHAAGSTRELRVSNLDVWNQIAAAKSLAKVRELQADPEVGGRGLISQDTPTNIFFFIASWKH